MISKVAGECYYFAYWSGEWLCSCDKERLRCLDVATLVIGRGRGHITRNKKERDFN